MKKAAREGDSIRDGYHCHGHDHGPQPSPGRIISGSAKVYIDGRKAASAGDQGYSPQCCGRVGKIDVLASPSKVFVDGKPIATEGTPTLHCGMGAGQIDSGSDKVGVR